MRWGSVLPSKSFISSFVYCTSSETHKVLYRRHDLSVSRRQKIFFSELVSWFQEQLNYVPCNAPKRCPPHAIQLRIVSCVVGSRWRRRWRR